jgi:hypothetical protein
VTILQLKALHFIDWRLRNLIVNVCDEYQGKGRNFGGTDSDFINGLQIPVGLDRPNEAKPWKILSQSLIYIFELKTLDLYYLQIFGSGEDLINWVSVIQVRWAYCNTTSWIELGVKLLLPIDFVVFKVLDGMWQKKRQLLNVFKQTHLLESSGFVELQKMERK